MLQLNPGHDDAVIGLMAIHLHPLPSPTSPPPSLWPLAEQYRLVTSSANEIIRRKKNMAVTLLRPIGEKWKNKLRTEMRKLNPNSMSNFNPPHYEWRATLIVPKDRCSGNASDWDTGADDTAVGMAALKTRT
ncbi:hypothetical protein HD554DRAFT_1008775 [Boletus coccyginus]|nr:hypothetical protein HD554DRAFT_1008775 [Boletus coccyginus]